LAIRIPTEPEQFDRYAMQDLIRTKHPEVTVRSSRVVDAAMTGNEQQQVSSAQRVGVEVGYGPEGPEDLPTRLVVKIARPDFGDLPLYRNEVNAYLQLGDELPVNMPQCVGGYHDPVAGTFALLLEDLRGDGALFQSVQTPMTVTQVESLLDGLARLHGAYWGSTRFDEDLAWVLPHTSGPIYDMFTDPNLIPALVTYEVATQQFKRELVESVGETADSLCAKVEIVRHHQASLAQTLLHGDCHVGNTYRSTDGRSGLLDWQLLARGYCMHDVTYLLITGLSVADRRQHERHLIGYYRDRLTESGAPGIPTPADLIAEYRLAAAWCFYAGWLTTPIGNYGWEITVGNHVRLATAYRDLESKRAIDDLRS
jgi:Phosphotransferase enzyme family